MILLGDVSNYVPICTVTETQADPLIVNRILVTT